MGMIINPFWTAGVTPFTFGFDAAPGLTNELWGGFPNLALGNAATAGPTTSGTATKLWLRTGTTGITADVRITIYATVSAQNWSTVPIATGVILGPVAASSTASVTVSAFTITNGQEYGFAVNCSANNVNFASVSDGNNQWWSATYAASPMSPGPNPTNNNGFSRAPAVWCSN